MICSNARSPWQILFSYVAIIQILLSQQGDASSCDYDVNDCGKYCGHNSCQHHQHGSVNCYQNDCCHQNNRVIYRRDPYSTTCPHHLHSHHNCHHKNPYAPYYPCNYHYGDFFNNNGLYNPDYFLRGMIPGCNSPGCCRKPKTKLKLSVVETLEYPTCEKPRKKCCKIVPECRLEEFLADHNLDEGDYRICPCPAWKIPRYYCVKYYKKDKCGKGKHKKSKGKKSYFKKASDALKFKSKDDSCDKC